jgi:hypothetical protein
MLADVIGNYVDSLTEREFDAPFIALLRVHEFIDIHFLHGGFEFGKDFIAKRAEGGISYQYSFQTKAGDIGLAEWRQCRGQIDMLRTDALAHPNFDAALPRRAVFATTGRLVGGASLAAQQYRSHLQHLNEMEFSTWDRDTIVEMLAVSPRSLSGSPLALLHILGSQRTALSFSPLEQHSRGWMRAECTSVSLRDVLEAAVIAHHCRRENRVDLACYTALMLIRSLWATTHGRNPLPETAGVCITTAKALFRHYATELWKACSGMYLDPDSLIRADHTPVSFLTYPVRCLSVVEILSMLALLDRDADSRLSADIADYLAQFVSFNSGASHPVSDRWGVSVVCCALLLYLSGKIGALNSYLTSLIKWVADHYDSGELGLAGPYSDPNEETTYLLGSRFEHIGIDRRAESYTATQLLDICAVTENQELFELARNEFLAVGICLPMLEFDDGLAQYSASAGGHHYEPNMPYEESWSPSDRWKVAPHHRRGPSEVYVESAGGIWNQLAISCVLRDRHFVRTWRRLVESRMDGTEALRIL